MSIPNDFMTEINKVIRTNSKDTAVTFLRLPEPLRKNTLREFLFDFNNKFLIYSLKI